MERPDFFTLKNGEKVKLPFSKSEYDRRVNNLRTIICLLYTSPSPRD